MNKFIIPHALQIVIDDFGWINGYDDRESGGPSRTGIPRKHCAEDYIAVNALGKALNMKINCAFVLGEWDPDNRMKKIPYFSKYGDDWDNAKYLDQAEMKRIIDALNASDYIDVSVHGLMHGSNTPGIDNNDSSDFFYEKDRKKYVFDDKLLRQKLDAFFGILDYYGVNKKVNSYIPSSALYVPNTLSKIMAEYGIRYMVQPFKYTDFEEKDAHLATVDNGIIITDRYNFINVEGFTCTMDIRPWDEIASDFMALPKATCIVGTHWPNYLHMDPKRSLELTENSAQYFKSCAEEFGTILSRDISHHATQELYKRYAHAEEKDGVFTLDVSEVPKPIGNLMKFYVSSKGPITECIGAKIFLYETKTSHFTYEVVPESDVISFK